jgi:hypothetical protein
MTQIRKIIITFPENIPEATALELVTRVVEGGRISKARGWLQFCFHTVFILRNISVTAKEKRHLYTDSFHVDEVKQ